MSPAKLARLLAEALYGLSKPPKDQADHEAKKAAAAYALAQAHNLGYLTNAK